MSGGRRALAAGALLCLLTACRCQRAEAPPPEEPPGGDQMDQPNERGPQPERVARAEALMLEFAERTGVREGTSRRYLWTDAFAVCNFLALARATDDERHGALALRLVERVHAELGHHRDDDPRTGWLDGASEAHPTRGGLRIGKPLPERGPGEPLDQRLEWDRDGQYFHYLTKWMHALDQVSRWTDHPRAALWSRELMHTAHEAFTYDAPGAPRMYWKMSVDLSRPLVTSMGQHDPLDGYVTTVQLQSDHEDDPPSLDDARADFGEMLEEGRFVTDDPLGLGGLLTDAYRVEQLMHAGFDGDELLLRLLADAEAGLSIFNRFFDPSEPAERRLAFRELGLAIGLAAVERMIEADRRGRFAGGPDARERLEALAVFVGLRGGIERFWLEDAHREARTWVEHRDINAVMLATSLLPDGFLELRPGD